jgi:hypothetical protein
MSLVGNIASKGFLPVPWLTLACGSITTGATLRICRMAIFWNIDNRDHERGTDAESDLRSQSAPYLEASVAHSA